MPLLASIYYSYKQFRITCNLFVKVMFKYVLNVLLIFATLIVPSIKLASIRFVEFTTALVRDLSISTAINIWLFVLFIKIMLHICPNFALNQFSLLSLFALRYDRFRFLLFILSYFHPSSNVITNQNKFWLLETYVSQYLSIVLLLSGMVYLLFHIKHETQESYL